MSFLLSFFCIFPYTLIGRTWRSGRSLTTSSDFFVKIISCCFQRSVPDLIYHQYGICRMYSKENPKDFRLPVPCLYPWEWVMLLLSTEAPFKPGGPFFWEFTSKHLPQRLIFCRSSLAHKGCGYPIYANNANRKFCTKYGISTSFVRKGRAARDESLRKVLRSELSKERATRLEGSFGTQKQHYSLSRIKARNRKTEILWIFFGIHTANAILMIEKIRRGHQTSSGTSCPVG